MLHHYQRHIIDTLAKAESCRYGELKPAELEGNIFSYHLKQLLAQKYIERTLSGDYALTQLGKSYVIHRYENKTTQAHSIFLIVVRVGDKWLLRERLVQPLLGYTGFIHGEPRYDEDVIETARNRLKKKTGIDCNLQVHASGLIKIFHENELQSHSHAILLSGEARSAQSTYLIPSDETGRNLLVDDSAMTSLKLLPSCYDIISTINNSQSWFEYTYKL